MSTVSAAEVGMTVDLPSLETTLTVGPRGDKCTGGMWVCVTHAEAFEHNFAKDSHISDGRDHALAWYCREHGGLEQP